MNAIRPSVAEERWLALAARHPGLRDAIECRGESGGWKQVTPLTRTLLFVLGVILASLVASIVMLVGLPWPGVVAGVAQIAAAEYLIRTRRMFACGIDEALWLSGAAGLTFQVLDTLGATDDAWPWIITVAALAAGMRLLNPWMIAIAAISSTLGLFVAFGSDWEPAVALPVSLCSFVLAVVALLASRRHYERPAHDAMVGAALVAYAACTHAWGVVAREAIRRDVPLDLTQWSTAMPLLLLAALGAACLACGVRWRAQAPLWAGLLCMAALLAEALRGFAWPWEWRLMAGGAVALLVAVAVERGLRRSRHGLTSRQVVADDALLDLLQLGGAAALTPAGATRPGGYEGGGGRFGGGGASGTF
jgi:uncharacterized membrane protein YgcG